jgi:hypothetical protein
MGRRGDDAALTKKDRVTADLSLMAARTSLARKIFLS